MDVVGLVLLVAAAVAGFGILIGFAVRVGGRGVADSEDMVARRRRELDVIVGRRRITVLRDSLPNQGDDGDAA